MIRIVPIAILLSLPCFSQDAGNQDTGNQASVPDWSGDWVSDRGLIQLVNSDDGVTGTLDGKIALVGSVDDGQLTLSYKSNRLPVMDWLDHVTSSDASQLARWAEEQAAASDWRNVGSALARARAIDAESTLASVSKQYEAAAAEKADSHLAAIQANVDESCRAILRRTTISDAESKRHEKV